MTCWKRSYRHEYGCILFYIVKIWKSTEEEIATKIEKEVTITYPACSMKNGKKNGIHGHEWTTTVMFS